ncbi:MAG: serine/threonine protein kinase [Myxococcales bacterium]|nr:serine/threonine protein kinase [Myxococcales bacterium]
MTDRDAQTVGPSNALAAPAPDPLVGAVVAGRFRVLERIGEGGMGAVYVAEHVALHKKVAIKTLHADMHANPEVRARFEREARAMAQLDHENVVAATDFGQLQDGTFFLAMEYIEGRSLREVTASDERVSLLRALKLLRQIASALTRAHNLGIVHRDLKPENILVVDRPGADELVKIIDFGIARMTSATDSEKPLTQTGVIFGTPHYMSPEQALGRRVDAAADQYAFGILAFELLAGRKPFDHKNLIDLLDLQVNGAIPRATSFAPELPPAIDGVFDRVLAKSPIERYASVADAMEAIDVALADAVARSAYAYASTEPASAMQHHNTVLASASDLTAPPTVSNTAPTVQDRAEPRSATQTGFVPPSKIAGLPVYWLGRFGYVPLVVLLPVLLVTVGVLLSGVYSVVYSLTHSNAPKGRALPMARRMSALRGESEVARALRVAARGDTTAAIEMLRGRRARRPHADDDGLVAYQLALLLSADRKNSEAVATFADAVSRDPSLVEDEPLVRALTKALADDSAASAAETLLHAASFAGSRTAARVLAEETVFGPTSDARRRAGRLARERIALLDATQRARVLLRTSDRCDELQTVVGQVARLGPGPAADDVARLRAGQCAMLARRSLCQCATGRD